MLIKNKYSSRIQTLSRSQWKNTQIRSKTDRLRNTAWVYTVASADLGLVIRIWFEFNLFKSQRASHVFK